MQWGKKERVAGFVKMPGGAIVDAKMIRVIDSTPSVGISTDHSNLNYLLHCRSFQGQTPHYGRTFIIEPHVLSIPSLKLSLLSLPFGVHY